MIDITQVRMRSLSSVINAVRSTRTTDMKVFVAGDAIKFTMVVSVADATSTIKISNPMTQAVVDNEGMTKEADYVYSYVYQTPTEDLYTGKWIVTYKATDANFTMLTQDKFILVTQNQ